jgi:hypothetical protein
MDTRQMILMFVPMEMEHVFLVTLAHAIVVTQVCRVKYRSVTLYLLIMLLFVPEMAPVQDTINVHVIVDTMAHNAQVLIVLRSWQAHHMHVRVMVVV